MRREGVFVGVEGGTEDVWSDSLKLEVERKVLVLTAKGNRRSIVGGGLRGRSPRSWDAFNLGHFVESQ
jgi:hypothetical protein